VAVTSAVAFVGLKGIAREMAAQQGGDGHGHSHDDQPTTEPDTGGADGHAPEPGFSEGSDDHRGVRDAVR
jgi:hypothetical protein